MILSIYYSFKNDVRIEEKNDVWYITSGYRKVELKKVSLGQRKALEMLIVGRVKENELIEIVRSTDEFMFVLQFMEMLKTLLSDFLIQHIEYKNIHQYDIIPISSVFTKKNEIDVNNNFVLSRFAFLHKENGHMVLESPLSNTKITIYGHDIILILHQLSLPKSVSDLYVIVKDISEEAIRDIITQLYHFEFLTIINTDGKTSEETNQSLITWEFHDLLFHSRSRMGRHDNQYGGTFRFLDRIAPLPAVKPLSANKIIQLKKPDINKLMKVDPTFSSVFENRSSIRNFNKIPLSLEQLSEFLFRTARIKKILSVKIDKSENRENYEYSQRTYPGGGACYELELYLSITNCKGIEPGFYHYCPKLHCLEKITELNNMVMTLLYSAKSAIKADDSDDLPQVLITYAARFQRLTWKYFSMAYAVILKNVGVLQQSMNLVAEAMGIGGCAIGVGDSDIFAKASGLNYYDETSVGEFVIGTKSAKTISGTKTYNPHGRVKLIYKED